MKPNLKRFEKTLDNGMRVVLIHKPDYAKSLFMIGIPAGGTNIHTQTEEGIVEFPSGCAHFLEHQMFRLDGQDVTLKLASMQAQTNAFTDFTQTCYYVMTTADPYGPLATLIRFVQNLDIDTASVEKEKGIILSEYNLYDSQPESRLLNAAIAALYHKHPIKEQVLGSRIDIAGMEVKQLEQFYKTFYDPSQLILAGVTGRDVQEVMDFIEEQEKAYPRKIKGHPSRYIYEEPKEVAKEEGRFSMDVSKPWCALSVKLDPLPDSRQALRMDFIVNLWLDGLFGVLNPRYQSWLDQRLITQSCGAEADFSSEFALMLIYSQSDRPEDFFGLVQDILKEKQMPSDEVLEALKIQYISSSLRALDQFETQAIDHIRFGFMNMDPLESIEMIRSITPDEIRKTIDKLDFSHIARIQIDPANPGMQADEESEEDFESEDDFEADMDEMESYL